MNNQRYKRINDYGVIGNRHSSALVGIDGSIDWCCLPNFDSPSVFAAILDANKGGKFQVCPADSYHHTQSFEKHTNIINTIFKTSEGEAKVTDFMPCFMHKGKFQAFNEIHRRVEHIGGDDDIKFRLYFQPRINYAKEKTSINSLPNGYIADSKNECVSLIFEEKINLDSNKTNSGDLLEGYFTISKEKPSNTFILKYNEKAIKSFDEYQSEYKLDKTRFYWRNWVFSIKYKGRFSEEIIRSALTLKLLQFAPTSALLAAATTSLPEDIGGSMNWDYRFSWIRDAGFTLWALSIIGSYQETTDYIDWLMDICSKHKPSIMLSIYGDTENLSEEKLPHLEGYNGSKPVRIGNAASNQFQLDIYGILLDAIYFSYKVMGRASNETYKTLVKVYAEDIVKSWQKPDNGIWEIRGERKYYTESRFWCYVGLDRAMKLARYLGYDDDANRWKSVRDEIKKDVLSKGWSEKKKSFTMFYGNDEILDAANLLMPLTKFLPASHPKMASTIEKIRQELSENDFIFRYRKTGNDLDGAFSVCSFWMVDCLLLLEKVDEAEKLFKKLLKYANHVGLYSEEIDPKTGDFLGNFPQAFTHMGLISAAVNLDKALSKRQDRNN